MNRPSLLSIVSSLALVTAIFSGACSSEGGSGGGADKPAYEGKFSRTELARAKNTLAKGICNTCHANNGKADSEVAKTMKARNLHDAEWQKTVTDEYLFDIISKGGAAYNKPTMTGYPNFDPAKHSGEVWALVKIIRDFAKK